MTHLNPYQQGSKCRPWTSLPNQIQPIL